ncbi:MAG TPA: spore germination protein [Bacillota bacterium]|nr:spore germination protein [Bacillota bacterium]HOL09760.1 spore germination protein [Bacillota bacterium]HPO98560.1 spore germination protein [Bacillota bacterium]
MTIKFSTTKEFSAFLSKEFNNSCDLKFETLLNDILVIVYLETVVNNQQVEAEIIGKLKTLGTERNFERRAHALTWDLVNSLIPLKEKSALTEVDELITELVNGKAIIFIAGNPTVYSFNTRGVVQRQLKEPAIERTVRGPQVSFNETIRDNLALIRQGIKSADLVLQNTVAGTRSNTEIIICYLESLVNRQVVAAVQQRLAAFEIDGIIDSGYVEQLISDNPYSVFPLTQSTERPDKAIMALLEGRVVILVDGSPQAIIVPVTLNELYQSPEDYYFGLWVGSFLRFFRIFGNNLAVALPGLYVALVGVNPELLPIRFALSISGSRAGVAVPLIIEILGMEIVIEVFREASLRLPNSLSQTLGVAAGVILGTAAIISGMVSTSTVVVVVITAIASFSGPDYSISLTWRILKFILIIAAAFLGLYGLTIAGIIILTNAVCQNSFGIPYLAPWSPINFRGLTDTVMRRPLWLRRRLATYHPTDKLRFQKRSKRD